MIHWKNTSYDRLSKELRLMDEAKERNAKSSEESFNSFMAHTTNKVGRGLGYHLNFLPRQFNKLWNYLFK